MLLLNFCGGFPAFSRRSITSILLITFIGLMGIYIREFVLDWRKYRLFEKQIDKLTQEIETLKQQRIVNP